MPTTHDPAPDTVESTAVSPTPASDEAATSERLAAAERIVKQNVYWSMGCGAVPVPVVDLVGIGGLQIRMLKQLSDLYGVKFSDHLARNIVAALIGTLGARALTVATVGSFIKTLPFAGALIGGIVAMPVIAGASTYAIGRVFVRHFELGGTFEDLNFARAKAYFSSQFRSGQKVAQTAPPPSAAASAAS